MSSDEKQIRRYYDFSYLLRPARRMPIKELEEFAYMIGEDKSKTIMVRSAVNALIVAGDIVYEKHSHNTRNFTGTEKNIADSTKGLIVLTIADIALEMLHSFSKQPKSGEIYGYLFDFEIFMLKSGFKDGPLHCSS